MDEQEQVIQDLTLAPMFLTSWTEGTGELPRCWKGYDFDVLDALAGKD